MQHLVALYSIVVGSATLWAWVTHFFYSGSMEEHLLPFIVMGTVTLPSSLLMEGLVLSSPWLLNSPAAMLSLVTVLGFFQVLLVWRLARFC